MTSSASCERAKWSSSFGDNPPVSFELGRALLLTEAISKEGLARALLAAARDRVSLVRAILSVGAMTRERLEAELSRSETPSMRAVMPVKELVARLPPQLCARLCAVPVRKDPRTGTIDVAVPDVRDAQGAAEIGYLLDAPVRVVRAPLQAIERAVSEPDHGTGPLSRRTGNTPAWGTTPVPAPRTSAAPPAPAAPLLELARQSTPVPPTWDIPIPLTRRSIHPEAGATSQRPALVLAKEPDGQRDFAPGDNLNDALENALERVIFLREPTTLIPPPAESVPPPPNTEPRPPTFPSVPPPPGVPLVVRRSQPPPPAGFYADAGAILAGLRAARDRDGVLELLLAGTRAVARKVALFIVKRDEFVGWSCTPELGEPALVREIVVATDAQSVLSYAATHGAYLGPLQETATHAHLLRVMGTASRDVAVTSVQVFGRATVMVLADDLGETMIATRRMEELAQAAGEALTRIVRDRAERG